MKLTNREIEALKECAKYTKGRYCWRVASMKKLESKGLVKHGEHVEGWGAGAWFITEQGEAELLSRIRAS